MIFTAQCGWCNDWVELGALAVHEEVCRQAGRPADPGGAGYRT